MRRSSGMGLEPQRTVARRKVSGRASAVLAAAPSAALNDRKRGRAIGLRRRQHRRRSPADISKALLVAFNTRPECKRACSGSVIFDQKDLEPEHAEHRSKRYGPRFLLARAARGGGGHGGWQSWGRRWFHGGGGGFRGGGFHGSGFHGGSFAAVHGGGFHGGGFHHRGGFHRHRFVGFGLIGPYAYGGYPYYNNYYDDGGCYLIRRRVMTRY